MMMVTTAAVAAVEWLVMALPLVMKAVLVGEVYSRAVMVKILILTEAGMVAAQLVVMEATMEEPTEPPVASAAAAAEATPPPE